jgi:hypothetical protein
VTVPFSQLSEPGVVVLRRDLISMGYDDRAIVAMLRGGELHRVRHGAYIGSATWSGLDERGRYAVRCRAVLRQAKAPVVLSHVAAVNEWGVDVWDVPMDVVDLTRLDGKAGRAAAGVRQHRGLVGAGDVRQRNGLSVTSPARACVELTTLVRDVEHALVVVDSFLHRKLTTPLELDTMVKQMEFWPDTLRSDLIVRLADGRSESVGETRSRHLCRTQRLPAPVPQYQIVDRSGKVVARVDLAWPALGLFLEFDGKEKYLLHRRAGESVADAVLREKRREEMICELTGWRCIRVTWADLYRPEHTASRIRAMFRPIAA